MTLSSNSIAAGNFVSAKNKVFGVSANVLPRKIVIIGTYDPSETEVIDEDPIQVFSPEDVGDKFGFGYMLHRLAVQAYEGSQGVETWCVPQSEVAGSQATGNIDFAGSTGVQAGTLYLYIAGLKVEVSITEGMSAAQIATAVVTACDADADLPTTQVVNGVTTSQVDFTSKSSGLWGDDISLSFNWGAGEAFPTGVTAAITAMSGGAGTPDIQDALDALGTGDDQNEDFFTDLIHGYGYQTSTLDDISNYNGVGNDFVGNYAKEVGRPFRSLTGDVTAGSAGLSALISFADGRLLDRTNGIIAVPDSPNHPQEIAALAMGIMARVNNNRAEESFIDKVLPNIIAGDRGADRWTSDYDNRDLAVRSGISPTQVKSGDVYMQNVVSFYRPASVPVTSNGYRSMRNISIIQNLINAIKTNFDGEKWDGISIVEDVGAVGNPTDAEKARDTDAVKDDLVALADASANNAWIYTASYTKENLTVTERAGLTGFDNTFPVIISGEGGILNTTIEFDISTVVLNS
jgi:phage tail sheath gpL-like